MRNIRTLARNFWVTTLITTTMTTNVTLENFQIEKCNFFDSKLVKVNENSFLKLLNFKIINTTITMSKYSNSANYLIVAD